MKRNIFYILSFVCLALTACEKKNLSEVSDILYIEREGAQMPVYIHGNAASKVFIIVLHGGPGGSGMEYRPGPFQDILENKYAMVYWDQRGQGMAQGAYPKEKLTIAQMVTDLEMLMDVIEYKYGETSKIFLLGHSWGGTLGSAFVTKEGNQSRIHGWIESNGAHDMPLLNKASIKMIKEVGVKQIAAGNHNDFWGEAISKVSDMDTNNVSADESLYLNQTAFEAETKLQDAGVIAAYDTTADGSLLLHSLIINNFITNYISGTITNLSLANEVEKASYTHLLPNVEVPTLLLWGRYDFVVPPKLGFDAYEKLGSSSKKLVIFEKSGHSPMATEPGLYANEIIEFVEAHLIN